MILKQENTEAVLLGEISTNTVGIDAKNIGLITTLLSTNLYSNPFKSFIREIIANAWDAQVEANNTEDPIILTLDNTKSNLKVSIRDYGTGLSEERFKNIYLNICSSSKRDTNNYIGCMGLGRLSALAVSDLVTINNYYNGTVYSYIMYLDGGLIHIDEVFTKETEEHNGLEVSLICNKVVTDNEIQSALNGIKYFEKVYLNLKGTFSYNIKLFNDRKILKFNNFKVCTYEWCPSFKREQFEIVMGNVTYSNPDGFPNFCMPSGLRLSTTISLKVNIGDILVTPSREGIILNDESKTLLSSIADNACKELLNNIYNKEYDFPSLWSIQKLKYVNYILRESDFVICEYNYKYLIPTLLENQILKLNNIPITEKTFNIEGSTQEIYEFIQKVQSLYCTYIKLPFFDPSHRISAYGESDSYTLDMIYGYLNNKNIYIVKDSHWTYTNKTIIKRNFNIWKKYLFIKESKWNGIIRIVYKFLKKSYKDINKTHLIAIYNDFKAILDKIQYFNPKDYEEEKSVKTVKPKDSSIFKYAIYAYCKSTKYYDRLVKAMWTEFTDLTNPEILFIYGTRNDETFKTVIHFIEYDLRKFYSFSHTKYKDFKYIEISTRDINTIENFSNVIYYEDFLHKRDSQISTFITCYYLRGKNMVLPYGKTTKSYDKYQDVFKYSSNLSCYNTTVIKEDILKTYSEKGWLKYNYITKAEECKKEDEKIMKRNKTYNDLLGSIGYSSSVVLRAIYNINNPKGLSIHEYKNDLKIVKAFMNYK